MRDQVQEAYDLVDSWIEGFEMTLGDDSNYTWGDWTNHPDGEWIDKYVKLLREWNKFVPEYNAAVAHSRRGSGRPIAASEAQQAEVHKLHKLGASLRDITRETSLGLQTVRTIIGKADGSDRTNRQRNELRKLELNSADALPRNTCLHPGRIHRRG
jgi:hypothetical protein